MIKSLPAVVHQQHDLCRMTCMHVSQLSTRRCTRSVIPSQPCTAVANQFRVVNRTLSGHYTPQCDGTNGTFQPYQCHPSTGYCWCVNVRTGQPISGFYPRGVRPNCTSEYVITKINVQCHVYYSLVPRLFASVLPSIHCTCTVVCSSLGTLVQKDKAKLLI